MDYYPETAADADQLLIIVNDQPSRLNRQSPHRFRRSSELAVQSTVQYSVVHVCTGS